MGSLWRVGRWSSARSLLQRSDEAVAQLVRSAVDAQTLPRAVAHLHAVHMQRVPPCANSVYDLLRVLCPAYHRRTSSPTQKRGACGD